jgi:hypothetical protein
MKRTTPILNKSNDEVYPAPLVVASVSVGHVPETAPDELASFIVPVVADGDINDWLLTPDTVAFGDPLLATQFKGWRSGWLPQWELDPVDNFQQLFRLVVDAGAINEPSQRLAEKFALTPFGAEESVLQPSRAVLLADLVERARSLVADIDIPGVGLVDTTGNPATSGLLAGWPLPSATKLLARDADASVSVHPTRRLCLEVYDDDGLVTEQVHDLTEVVFEGTTAIVRTAERAVEFDADRVRPLAWIALGARSYRVRRVPAVIIAAKTIARLPEAARCAIEHGSDLVLSGIAPVVAGR